MRFAASLAAGRVLGTFRRLGEIARKPLDGARGRLALRRVRKLIAGEFSRAHGYGPGNGQQTWRQTQPFGTRPATRPALGGPGSALAQAWQGGPGGFQSLGPRSVRFGVSLVYAQIHREGGQIGVTPKMRRFVAWRFGVNLRPDKKTIVIPKRPHADMRAPIFQRAARDVVVEAFTEAQAA